MGFGDVVDACGAAADFRVGQFHKFEIGNGAQKCAWSFANFLAVEQVAGILVGDAQWKRLHFCGETESGEKFSHVASFCGEGESLGVFWFVW